MEDFNTEDSKMCWRSRRISDSIRLLPAHLVNKMCRGELTVIEINYNHVLCLFKDNMFLLWRMVPGAGEWS